jgi:hypothetical protein
VSNPREPRCAEHSVSPSNSAPVRLSPKVGQQITGIADARLEFRQRLADQLAALDPDTGR